MYSMPSATDVARARVELHRILRTWLGLAALLVCVPAWAQANLSVSWSPASPTYVPGCTSPTSHTGCAAQTYTWTVSNAAGADSDTPALSTNFPAAATVTWSCSATGATCGNASGSGNLAHGNDTLPAGGSVSYAFTAWFPANHADTTVSVTGTANPDSGTTRSAVIDIVRQLKSDLSIDKSSTYASYVPGLGGQYVLTATNAGPSNTSGVTVTDTAPANVTINNWTCTRSDATACADPSGSGNLSESNAMPVGVTYTYTLDVSFGLLASGVITNTASLTLPANTIDPVPGDTSDTATTSRVLQSLFTVAFLNQVAGQTYVPGTLDNSLTLRVTNTGGSSASVPLTIDLLASAVAASSGWTCAAGCSPASGSGDVSTTVTLPGLGTADIVLLLDYDSGALTANLAHTAVLDVDNPVLTPDPANDPADIRTTASYAIERRADLRVVKTVSDAIAIPGQPFLYTITVSNLGPSDIGNGGGDAGALLTDDFAAALRGGATCGNGPLPCWSYCPSDDGSVRTLTVANCPVTLVSGSGDLTAAGFKLRAGSSSELRASVSTAPNTEGGTVIGNTATVAPATVSPAVADPGAGNNSSSTSTTIELGTDIEVTKSDGATSAIAGGLVTYTVTVRNNGFNTANGVSISDAMPLFAGSGAGFIPGSISWQCSAVAGACCVSGGASDSCGRTAPTAPIALNPLSASVDLPGQSQVVFSITGRTDPAATGALDNSATATLPVGLTDAQPANNTARDNDTLLVAAHSLTLEKRLLSLQPVADHFLLTYEIVVANGGPSRAVGVDVSDPLDLAPLLPAGASWSCAVQGNPALAGCSAAGGTGALATQVDLSAGGAVRFVVTVSTTDGATGVVTNTASADSGADTAEDTVTSNLTGTGDLSVTKTDNRTEAVPGTENEYVITVRNAGPDDVFGAQLLDTLPPELDGASWTCAATTPVPGDLNFLQRDGDTVGGVALVQGSDGRHVYVASPGGKSVAVYQRASVPGLGFGDVSLLETEIDTINDVSDVGGAVSGLQAPVDLALSPDGAMLYVLSQALAPATPAVVAFNRVNNPADPSYGRLSFAGVIATGLPATPRRLAVTTGNVYVSGDASSIAILRRAAGTGLLSLDITFSGVDVPADPGPLAWSASDALLFVGSGSGGRVAAFRIEPAIGANPAGRLATTPAVLSDADLAGAADFALAPQQRHLYVVGSSAQRLVLLRYGAAGASLTKGFSYDRTIAGANANLTFGPTAQIALAPDGEHLLASNGGTAVDRAPALLRLRRDEPTGGLSFESQILSGLGLTGASDLAVTPDGRHVLISTSVDDETTPQLAVYTRRAPDPLLGFLEVDREGDAYPGGVLSGLQAPADIAVSADGAHVYAVSLAEGALTVFEREVRNGEDGSSDGGHLSFLAVYRDGGGISGLDRARRVLISPNGQNVYVSSEDNNTVAVFSRDANTGLLTWRQRLRDGDGTPQGTIDGLLGAQGMAMDEASTHLYVAGSFEAAVAAFRRDPALGTLTYLGVVKGGSNGAVGMNGMRDLVVTRDGLQVLGVSSLSNAVVAFLRQGEDSVAPDYGRLTFLQARTTTGVRLMSLAIPNTVGAPDDDDHVYAVGQDDDSLIVLRRVTDRSSSAFGTLSTLFEYRGVGGMNGPFDLVLSADGRRVYVGAQFDHSLLIFDRDLNQTSMGYGALRLVETRVDGADGVDGLSNLYALGTSRDARHVYVAGFGDRAVASFAIGSGSYCSAGGSGSIDDLVNIGAGGTLEFRVRATIRPEATGVLRNTVTITAPERFTDATPGNDTAQDDTNLTPQGDITLSKTNGVLSVVAGETVRYTVEIRNPGPSNLVHTAGAPLTFTDALDSLPGFVPGSARWTCAASGSGALSFVDDYREGAAPLDRLAGVGALALLPDSDGNGPLPAFLAAAAVLDDAVTFYARDPADGRLDDVRAIVQGANPAPVSATLDGLGGARALAASADGRFLYVASRDGDAVGVFRLENDGSGGLRVVQVEVQRGRLGLDQASHLALSGNGGFLYVAGANDDAIAVFRRDAASGALTWVESEQNGINDATDAGGTVAGLDGVAHLVLSPDGGHLYALAGGAGSVARFDVDALTGRLSWREVVDGDDLGLGLAGAAAAVFDASGAYLYLAAADAHRVLVLGRRNSPSAGNYGELRLLSSVTQEQDGAFGLLSPRALALSDDGRHLYVTAQDGASIAWYGRDPDDGSLGFLGLRSAESSDVSGMEGASALVLDDALDQVYVAGTLAPAVVQFERSADSSCPASGSGQLLAVPFDIAAGGSVVFTIDVEVSSTLSGDLVNTASVDAAGDPTPGNNSASDSDSPSRVADLSITKDDGLAEYDGLAGARALVGTADHLYTAGASDNAIGVFGRTSAGPQLGALQFLDVVRSGSQGVLGLNGVTDLVLSGDASHLYAVSPVDNSVATFRRGADGALTYLELQRNGVFGVSAMSGARAAALSPDGSHLYVAAGFSNAVAMFRRNTDAGSADFGRLTFLGALQNGVGGVDGLLQATALAVSPEGTHVYVLGGGGTTLAVFLRNPNPGSGGFGQLTFLKRYVGAPGAVSGLEAARALAFGTGTNLYVLGAAPGTLARFVRTPANGDLALAEVLEDGQGLVTGLAGASRLRLAPGGSQLYVAGDGSVTHYDLDAAGVASFSGRIADGDAAPAGGQVSGLAGGADVLVSPDGAQVYVVAADAAALSGFDRSAAPAGLGDLAYRQTLFDGLGGIAPGEQVRYRIRVANAGPANVPAARIVDAFPPQFVAVSWICTEQTGGAQCNASGSGSLDTTALLPPGASLVYEATGTLGDAVGGTLVNTATVSALDVSDPELGNNSATDGDTVLSPAQDLVVQVAPGIAPGVPGGPIDYLVTVDNLGPSYASGARFTDLLPAAVHDLQWSCRATPVAGLLGALPPPAVPAGSSVEVRNIAPSSLGLHLYATAEIDRVPASGGNPEIPGIGRVLVYGRDPFDGELTPLQALSDGTAGVGGIGGAHGLVLSDDERFLYVAGSRSDSIAVFARDSATGLLTYVTRYQDGVLGIDGLGGVRTLRLAPGGGHLYAAGATDDAIAIFSVNPGTGLLTAAGVVRQSDPGMDGLNGVQDLAFSGNGGFLLAASRDNQALVVFQRNAISGALTRRVLLQEFQLGNGVLAAPVALEVSGTRVFVASATGSVGEFGFDPAAATPALVARANPIAALADPADLLFDADQARLYVATRGSGQVRIYSLLGAVPEAIGQVAATQAASLARVPNTRHLYSGGAAIQAWDIARGSRCAALSGSGALAEQALDIAPGGRVEFTLTGALFANATGELRYAVEIQPRSEGAELNPTDNRDEDVRDLRPVPALNASKTDNLAQVVAGRTLTWTMALGNAGPSAAVSARLLDNAPLFPANAAGVAPGSLAWRCAVDPALALQQNHVGQDALSAVGDVAVAPDGSRVYAVSATRDALLVYDRLPDGRLGTLQEIRDGSVLLGETVQGLDGASSVAVSSDGRAVLVTGAAANSLVVFERDLATGAHRLLQRLQSGSDGVAGLIGAEDVVIGSDGRYVFVASPASDSIAGFRRDPATGRLSFIERVRDGFGTIVPDSDVLLGVRRLQISRDGANLYALAGGSHALSSFRIDPDSGVLAYLGVTRRASVAGLEGARDLAGADGERHLYVLGNGAIVRFDRQPDGRLLPAATTSGAPGLANPRSLLFDPDGSRLYVVDGGGALSIFARDWASGALAWRQRIGAVDPVPAGGARAAYDATRGELFVSVADAGKLSRYIERPLSHCQAAGATQDAIDTRLDLDVGGNAQVQLDARVHPSARGVLRNALRLEPAAGSAASAAPALAQDDTTILVESDLSVSKSAPARAVAGSDIAYQIRVLNAGPSDALGIRVIETLPAALRDVTWTCSATASSGCPASGNTTLDFLANVKVGDELTINLQGRIAPDFVGDLANQVALVGEPGATDPDSADLLAVSHTDVVREVDIEVSKSNGVTSVVAGTSTTYQIAIANIGPSDAPAVTVSDALPANALSGAWTCSASGGATCPAQGSGAIAFTAAMPAGSALALVSTLQLADTARGTLDNLVGASVPAGVTERDPSDNSARDLDAIEVRADLEVILVDAIDPFDPAVASGLPYQFVVRNLGPSSAVGVRMVTTFTPSVSMGLPPSCSFDGTVLDCDLMTMRAGAQVTIARNLTSLPAPPSTLAAYATVNSSDPDPVPANNTAQQNTDLVAGGDIAVTLLRPAPLVFGEAAVYVVTVANIASQRVADVDVEVPLPAKLVSATWSCEAFGGALCPAPSGTGAIDQRVALGGGEQLRFTLRATIDPMLDPIVPHTIELAARALPPAGQDINLGNNQATDTGVLSYGLFRDGFEGSGAAVKWRESQR
jgi:uncharacterized repeat protein (TIGR01451 family)